MIMLGWGQTPSPVGMLGGHPYGVVFQLGCGACSAGLTCLLTLLTFVFSWCRGSTLVGLAALLSWQFRCLFVLVVWLIDLFLCLAFI